MKETYSASVLLFDVCGVLFDVSGGVACMLEWLHLRIDEGELLKRWVSSPHVRGFELGRIGIREFARGVVGEFNLPVDESRFIRNYLAWHKGPYPGAVDLIRELSGKYITASFSNINRLQWSKIGASGLLDSMRYNFASYQIGLLKPDREAFSYVVDHLGCEPSHILFFDDNQANVDAANKMKIHGYRTRGTHELKDKLHHLIGWG